MSTENKPSRNEDEYFLKQEQELLLRQREQLRTAQEEAERRSHYMKCPKDGHDLQTVTFHGVQIETCQHCRGIWLDAGELETIEAHEDRPGLLGRVLNDLFTSFGRGPRSRVG